MASGSVLCPRFIGRERELATVAEQFREAAGGSGAVVLIAGDAGIGKSRFISTVRNVVEDDGGRFALAQCLQHAQSPLGPLTDALAVLHAADPTVLQEQRLREGLSRLLPDLLGATGTEAPESRRAQYAAIADALRRFSERQALAIAVEDAHWADLATLEFLQYFSPRFGGLRLLLLVTYRSDELHRRHPLALALPKIERAGRTTVVALAPLTRSEMQSFVASALGGRSGTAGARIRDVIELAEGNPLFAEELLAHMTGEDGAERSLPLSIRASVLERSAALDERGREILCSAAALGRRFDSGLLSKLCGFPQHEVGAILRRARDLQLIAESRSDATFVFRHALVQEALHDDLLASEARDLHARIARELEETPASDERTMQLAYHSWAARDRRHATAYNEAAGDVAVRRLALADATRLYERALEFAGEDEAVEAALNAKLARTLSAFDPGESARRAFERSISYYERTGDRARAAELLLDLGRFEWVTGAQLETRRRALEIMEPLPEHPVRFGVLTELACWYTLVAEPDTAAEYLSQAQPLAGSPKLRYLAHYHTIRARLALLRGDVDEMAASHEEAVRIAGETTDFEELCAGTSAAAWGALMVGDFASARRGFDAAVRIAQERFLHDREAINVGHSALLEAFAGNLQRASSLLSQCAELSIDLERPYSRIHQATVAIVLYLQTGDAGLIDRFVRDDLVELAFSTGEASVFAMTATPFAELYAARGERERAAALVQRTIAGMRSIGWYPQLAVTAARLADPAVAANAGDMLRRWARPGNRAGLAYLDLFDALAASGGADAAASASRAAQRFSSIGYPRYEALALETAGRRREALAIYRRIGDLVDAGRLEERLNPVNRRGRAKSQLTAREHEVAALIAQAKSNRAIAETLVVSERTVEHHVASILAKFEARSRAEIVAAYLRP